MVRWPISIVLVGLTAFSFLAASVRRPIPLQPLHFSHKLHLDYFRDGHARSMVSLHHELFEDFLSGGHGKSMAKRHREILLKELED